MRQTAAGDTLGIRGKQTQWLGVGVSFSYALQSLLNAFATMLPT